MHAIILAGGFGTRLRSVISDVPKPLAPIGNKPFLAWLVELLAKKGFTHVTLSVHHEWEKIQDYFDAHPAPLAISYAIEDEPLGTGGAIVYSLKQSKTKAPVFVLNGDSFTKVDYNVLYAHHCASQAGLTLTLREVADSGRYGRVMTEEGIITSFAPGIKGISGMINAGIYVLNPDLFDAYSLPKAFSFEQDFLPLHLNTLKPRSFTAEGYFIDIGIPEDYARACKELPEMIKE